MLNQIKNFPSNDMRDHLKEIIENRRLTAVFQPIISMRDGHIIGFEGLIRGPSDSLLHSPINLFKAANLNKLSVVMEQLCRQVVLETFVKLGLIGKLFLNVSPECLLKPDFKQGETLCYMQNLGINPDQVIIELTESQPTFDYNLLREATTHYREMGFEIAIDDLGEGFSGLRLWSEIRPDYVKIDKHFIQNINQDPLKLQFVQSIQKIAENAAARVIAEGIETQAELMIIKDLGIDFGQGYHIARPSSTPSVIAPIEISKALCLPGITVYPQSKSLTQNTISASRLLIEVPVVTPDTMNEEVYKIFSESPALQAIPVVKNGTPVGMINRHMLIDSFSKLYSRELYGKKACSKFMDSAPMIVDKDISIQALSHLMVASERRYLSDGFIITSKGEYIGIGTGHDLMREITQMQITAARYANPLTLLPGNVPINEHIDRLIHSQASFVVCYCDLDNFKPFNDKYGYRRGDDIIQLTGKTLSNICNPDCDFIGHIGGDDFFILFQSADWEERCQDALSEFSKLIAPFFSASDFAQGGFITADRKNEQVFQPLTTLSIGAVRIEPGIFNSHNEVSSVAAEAKKRAKAIHGNSLFIDRRHYCNETRDCHSTEECALIT
ncbi:diguanylate cyclase (GGDEF)-like protein [Sulfurirhabdus autotrophica]|uniref:Diguanylate cyclase (GGDEF)-like protein n=2 Tax=Sulfurirhabdus autotrophica TaxID=1706046 RepID=A0A4R3YHP8_9PROT|nr:diguanylate cyclase (GGDEF)-like protein [Sulfurirhabdus autotrophica]